MTGPLAAPPELARTVTALHGDVGVRWLRDLPMLLAECERRWSVTIAPPFEKLSYNYVAPALCADGARVVLKAGLPNRELTSEIAALRLYDGRGCVRVLDADADVGVLLLERAEPGTSLATVAVHDDAAATSAAAAVMRRLWRPAPRNHSFPHVAGWADGLRRLRQRFDGGTGPLPRELVEKAEALFAELIPSMSALVVLHGDLHHDNILIGAREPWLAIDPKGIIGEPAYEVGALLRNPEWLKRAPNARALLAWRVDQLASELGLDRARVRGWGVAQAVLSAWWSIEDEGAGWEWAIRCAELL
ncbi:MAG: aminoglycoside phosphotransferase family protein [Gemmatimonadaceae bacterium]